VYDCPVRQLTRTPPLRSAAQGSEPNLVDTTEKFYTRHFDANIKGPIFLIKAVEPHIAKGGRIVFISSAGARLGVAGQTVYAATKAANEAPARVWAKELGQSHGITVNRVNPGPIATGKCRQHMSSVRLCFKTDSANKMGQINGFTAMNSSSKICSSPGWRRGRHCAFGGIPL
jgi:NAD(P)-dependent dehydrogenase (short-subunit alcohol dehydrogenase family)